MSEPIFPNPEFVDAPKDTPFILRDDDKVYLCGVDYSEDKHVIRRDPNPESPYLKG